MKRIFTILCAIALVIAGDVPLSAEAGSGASYSPIFVEEYNYGDFDELGITKTYQLSPSDDPRLIPTEDFELGGRRYSSSFRRGSTKTCSACSMPSKSGTCLSRIVRWTSSTAVAPS